MQQDGTQGVASGGDLPGQAGAPVPTGFVVLPKRWVVERTHAWNERSRRLVIHHDRSTLIAAASVWFAQARILVSRLAV